MPELNRTLLIEKLNVAIAVELTGVLQYNQYARTIQGHERQIWQEFFDDSCKEALSHAQTFGDRVTALGGVHCVEPNAVKQTTDINEMLENSLALERSAVAAYIEAHAAAEGSIAHQNLIEDQIQAENEDVEEIEMFLKKVKRVAAAGGGSAAESA